MRMYEAAGQPENQTKGCATQRFCPPFLVFLEVCFNPNRSQRKTLSTFEQSLKKSALFVGAFFRRQDKLESWSDLSTLSDAIQEPTCWVGMTDGRQMPSSMRFLA